MDSHLFLMKYVRLFGFFLISRLGSPLDFIAIFVLCITRANSHSYIHNCSIPICMFIYLFVVFSSNRELSTQKTFIAEP